MSSKKFILDSPINWYGGKGGDVQRKLLNKIIYYIEQANSNIFVDIFAGSGIVSLNVEKPIIIYNDINKKLINFFNVLRDYELSEKLVRRLSLTLYSKGEYELLQSQLDINCGMVENAAKFYVATMQSINASGAMIKKQTWRNSKSKSRRGMAQCVSSWLRNIDENLPDVVEKFREMQVTNYDVFECIDKYDKENVVFYFDPPYIQDERIYKKVYSNEFTLKNHKELINKLLTLKGKSVISGYDSSIYDNLVENGWRKEIIKSKTSATINNKKRINRDSNEVIWYKI
ncbi:DNA adenine methylase [Clostridium sp. SHJSY1]|uniref:DNA adenine methylase n=1 Tax=Clostridium sp. SHJSY1 TaxID=2942483 RepID=UPI002876E1CC|nr:DNA adenine methylase [Clostridium sp. SHJSY1]MDS0525908.1 DNA adenine methylase [Clostridium sp. SHJSY1]